MRGYRPRGLVWINDGYKTVEHETFTCGHCQQIVVVPHRCRPEDAGGLCHGCMHLVCPRCADDPTCRPIEKWCEDQERRDRTLRDMGFVE